MSDAVISLPRRKPLVLADLLPGTLARDALLVLGAAGFVGALAQISIHLSFTPVPITGQTLGVLLAGTALGWKRGTVAMAVYALAGLAGVPWFAGGASGYAGASFGYVIGFICCAALCGFLAEHGADRVILKSVPAMLAGEIIMYGVGVAWLGFYLHVGPAKAIALGLTPFLIGDAIKAAIAAALLPGAWELTGRKLSGPARRPRPAHRRCLRSRRQSHIRDVSPRLARQSAAWSGAAGPSSASRTAVPDAAGGAGGGPQPGTI